MVEYSFTNEVVVVSSLVALTSDILLVLSKASLDIQVTIECGFPLKRVRDMIRTYRLV